MRHLVDDVDHVTALHDRLTHLRGIALTTGESAALIRRLADGVGQL